MLRGRAPKLPEGGWGWLTKRTGWSVQRAPRRNNCSEMGRHAGPERSQTSPIVMAAIQRRHAPETGGAVTGGKRGKDACAAAKDCGSTHAGCALPYKTQVAPGFLFRPCGRGNSRSGLPAKVIPFPESSFPGPIAWTEGQLKPALPRPMSGLPAWARKRIGLLPFPSSEAPSGRLGG